MICCVVLPLVVSCQCRLHETSPSLGLGEDIVVTETYTPVYDFFPRGLFWIHMFNAMVRFILITSLVVADACMESIIISRYLLKFGQYLSFGPPT